MTTATQKLRGPDMIYCEHFKCTMSKAKCAKESGVGVLKALVTSGSEPKTRMLPEARRLRAAQCRKCAGVR